MTLVEKLPQLEIALLDLVSKGPGLSWYQIETKLSRMDVPRSPNAITVLKSLLERGLVTHEVTEGSPKDCWKITIEGMNKLNISNSL